MKTFIEFLMEGPHTRSPLGGVLPYHSKREKRKLHARIYKGSDIVPLSFNLPNGERVRTQVKQIFPSYKPATETLVPVDKIRATQKFLDPKILKMYMSKKKLDWNRDLEQHPGMWKFNGHYYPQDGHHRLVARMKRGSKHIKAWVYDLDD